MSSIRGMLDAVQAQRIGIESAARQENHSPGPRRTRRTEHGPAGRAVDRRSRRSPITTSCRSTASTTSSCTWATRCRPPTSTRTPSASSGVAYRGLETGTRDQVSHVLQQGRIRLVLTGALHSDSPIAAHQHKHGDGVKVIALSVPSVDHAYREATSRGAESVAEPHEISDEHGTVTLATIKTYGETLHTFVERDGYDGPVPPRLRRPSRTAPRTAGCCWPSTTSSATSSSARWRRGSSTTRTSSG